MNMLKLQASAGAALFTLAAVMVPGPTAASAQGARSLRGWRSLQGWRSGRGRRVRG